MGLGFPIEPTSALLVTPIEPPATISVTPERSNSLASMQVCNDAASATGPFSLTVNFAVL